MLGSELFAKAHSKRCEGRQQCHWCSAPCTDQWVHDDVAQLPFERSKSTAKRPNNSYICQGCLLYNRKSVTIKHLTGGIKDRQWVGNHSWYMTLNGIWTLRSQDHQELYTRLFAPPRVFSLSLSDGKVSPLIQLSIVNEVTEIKADTPLTFTLNNIPHVYSIYELEHAIDHEVDGKMPGVRVLIDYLGKCTTRPNRDEKRERGRPLKKDDSPQRKIKEV